MNTNKMVQITGRNVQDVIKKQKKHPIQGIKS